MSSSVLHLRIVDRDAVLPALTEVLGDAGFLHRETVPVARRGPYATKGHDEATGSGPCYVVSQGGLSWLCVLQAHAYIDGAPDLVVVGERVSRALSCFALTLDEHDGDVFMYALHRDGKKLDAYNSNPMHMRRRDEFELTVEQLRHAPEAFAPLLPEGRSVAELRGLLDRGWWAAHDGGRLNRLGLAPRGADGFAFEGDRLAALGELLSLYPSPKYPFAAWADARDIDWASFVECRYARASHKPRRSERPTRRR